MSRPGRPANEPQTWFGRELRNIRLAADITQSRAAEILWRSRMTIHRWETSKDIPDWLACEGALHRLREHFGWPCIPEKTKHRLYSTWKGMKVRCGPFCWSEKRPLQKNYHDRGIRMCARWRHSFEAFVADMGLKPGAEYSIDRINNDGNYEPGNCRWATPKQQIQNRRSQRKATP